MFKRFYWVLGLIILFGCEGEIDCSVPIAEFEISYTSYDEFTWKYKDKKRHYIAYRACETELQSEMYSGSKGIYDFYAKDLDLETMANDAQRNEYLLLRNDVWNLHTNLNEASIEDLRNYDKDFYTNGKWYFETELAKNKIELQHAFEQGMFTPFDEDKLEDMIQFKRSAYFEYLDGIINNLQDPKVDFEYFESNSDDPNLTTFWGTSTYRLLDDWIENRPVASFNELYSLLGEDKFSGYKVRMSLKVDVKPLALYLPLENLNDDSGGKTWIYKDNSARKPWGTPVEYKNYKTILDNEYTFLKGERVRYHPGENLTTAEINEKVFENGPDYIYGLYEDQTKIGGAKGFYLNQVESYRQGEISVPLKITITSDIDSKRSNTYTFRVSDYGFNQITLTMENPDLANDFILADFVVKEAVTYDQFIKQ
ncbi:MAG: hypothetical protein JXQ87_06965 [Bacteroidia bacterium]